jgi:hypothetical protein
MISGFHITASIQPPTVNLENGGTTHTQASIPNFAAINGTHIPEDTLASLVTRIEKLEAEVFKTERSMPDEFQKVAKMEPNEPKLLALASLPANGDEAASESSLAWSKVFDEVVRRVDSCAGQPSVNECLVQMKQLKRDITTLSRSLANSKVSVSDVQTIEAFMDTNRPDEPEPVESLVKHNTRKDDEWWRSSLPRHILRPAGAQMKRTSNAQERKWGPCFYCPCTEWKPGHSCEGQRQAQQRKREKESSRGS